MNSEDLKPGDLVKIGKSNYLYPDLYGMIVEYPVPIPNKILIYWSTETDQAASVLLQNGGFLPWIHVTWLEKVEEQRDVSNA